MKSFAEAWPEESILQQAAAKLPWFHNCVILDKIKGSKERLWYTQAAIEHGWSRNVLTIQIEAGLHQRQGKAITNFTKALPAPQSGLAQQLLKDPYNFDFLTLSKDADEREVETGLVAHIQKFLLELGTGFAFLGRQYPLEVAGEDYRLDLLFYHIKLRCFVIIDLKTGPFKPEYAGKMNFYLAAVFTSTVGTPLEQRRVHRIFQSLCDQAGVRRIRFHDVRHSAASILIAHGVHPKAIQELLRHSSIQITMDTYGHLFEQVRKETADKMDAILAVEKSATAEPVAVNVAVRPDWSA
jgi:predicted nuclease of restriction endonuclease-like (RecB) superfamily